MRWWAKSPGWLARGLLPLLAVRFVLFVQMQPLHILRPIVAWVTQQLDGFRLPLHGGVELSGLGESRGKRVEALRFAPFRQFARALRMGNRLCAVAEPRIRARRENPGDFVVGTDQGVV